MCRFSCSVPAVPGDILSLWRLLSLYSHLCHQSVAASPLGRSDHEIMPLKEEKIIPTVVGVIYFFKAAPHTLFPCPWVLWQQQDQSFLICSCKLQIEFSPCLCRPHLSDDFIAFMEPFVVQLPFFSCFFFEIEMTQTRYTALKNGKEEREACGMVCFLH